MVRAMGGQWCWWWWWWYGHGHGKGKDVVVMGGMGMAMGGQWWQAGGALAGVVVAMSRGAAVAGMVAAHEMPGNDLVAVFGLVVSPAKAEACRHIEGPAVEGGFLGGPGGPD